MQQSRKAFMSRRKREIVCVCVCVCVSMHPMDVDRERERGRGGSARKRKQNKMYNRHRIEHVHTTLTPRAHKHTPRTGERKTLQIISCHTHAHLRNAHGV